MEQIKPTKLPLIFVLIATFALSLSINYCGNLAPAKVAKLKIEGQMNAVDIDLRLPMKLVRNIDEGK